jgi:two-component system OmpR family sensor kinase
MQIQVDTLAPEPPERFQQGRTAIAKGVARTTALVNQLLQLARLDESTPPNLEPVELGPLLLDCVSEYIVLAENKGIDLGASIDEPVWLNGSPLEMRSLFANLIDNAVRYTPTGGKVDVHLYRRASKAVVDVLDSGQGLKPGSDAHIFDRFYRAAPAEVDGTGLGLAIAMRIAERHGLALTVENRTDRHRGVLARVTLPL